MDHSVHITEIKFDGAMPVDSYGPGFFRVAEQIIHGPVLLLPGLVLNWGGFDDRQEILKSSQDIDVLLVGTGAEMAILPVDLRAALDAADLGVESMATPAACRTYNVLLAEGRRVALAMLPV